MKAEDLKNSILQLAMQGKLMPQEDNDEPASVLLEKIKKEKEQLIKNKKIKRNNKESFIYKENGHIYEKIGKKGESICIDDEVPFEIPDSWEWVRINTIREVYTGNSINKTEKESKFMGLKEGYNYIATKDVGFDNSIDYNNGVKIPENLDNFRIANSGSVLLCIEGGSAGRKIGMINQDVCFGNKLACFKTFVDDNNFLFYYLQSPNFKEIFKSKTTGIIGGVGIAKLRGVLMPIPPFNEQKRIVDKIEELLPLIDEYGINEEQLFKLNNELPTKLKDSILQEAVQGNLVPQDPNDESAQVLLEKIKQEKEKLIKAKKIKKNNKESVIYKEDGHYYEKISKKGESVCIDDEIPFNIPDNWYWCKLENIVELINGDRGKNYPAKNKLSTVSGIPFISAVNMSNGRISRNNLYYLSQNQYDLLSGGKLKKNDIVFCLRGSVGKNSIFNLENGAIASTLVILRRYTNDIFLKYLFYYLNSPLANAEISKHDSGTAQPQLSAANLKKFFIPIPPLNEQKRIVDKIEQLLENIDVLIED